jgi:hypothetical protein
MRVVLLLAALALAACHSKSHSALLLCPAGFAVTYCHGMYSCTPAGTGGVTCTDPQ